ncbi:MAG: PAS domain S-box protein [bacterium]|nr:PAS domain S-box protein [bacterium]
MDKIGKPLNILLVEDSKFDRDFFKISFQSSKIETDITECINAEGALKRLALDHSCFDVVVVDHTLPGMTGLRLAEKIMAKGYNLPVLLVTGTGSEELAVEAMKAGVDDYIIKGSEVHKKIFPQLVERAVRKFTNRLELEKAQKALRESEEKFRSVTESANDAIISIDDEGRIISWNSGAVNHFGYEGEEILGMPVMVLLPDRYSKAHIKGVEKALRKGGLSFKDHKTFDVFAMRKDGKEVSVEISLSSWKAGDRIYFSAIIRDITARVSAESRLRKLNNAIEQSPDPRIKQWKW